MGGPRPLPKAKWRDATERNAMRGEESILQAIDSALTERDNCRKSGNSLWEDRWDEYLSDLVSELPSGSGIDAGSKLDEDRSRPDRIVIAADFHHMDEGGGYDGWTEHTIVATPSFQGFDIRVTGRNRNDIKDYLADVYRDALSRTAPAMRPESTPPMERLPAEKTNPRKGMKLSPYSDAVEGD